MSSPTTTTSSDQAVDPAAKPTRRTFTNEYRNKIIDEYAQAPRDIVNTCGSGTFRRPPIRRFPARLLTLRA